MKAIRYVTDLASRGRYTFTSSQAREALGVSPTATRAALRRLQAKGALAMPARGFHVIVPPEYRALGCLPGGEFVPELMAFLEISYYAGLLTAAEIHGAAHHKPQVFQIVTDRSRRPAGAGGVRFVFVAKASASATPTEDHVTDHGFLHVSTPEATAFDLVTFMAHGGGLDNVATVLAELAEQLDPERLADLARHGTTPLAVVQRLGFLLDHTGNGRLTLPLAGYVDEMTPPVAPLRPGRPRRDAPRDRRWRLAVNAHVEPDL